MLNELLNEFIKNKYNYEIQSDKHYAHGEYYDGIHIYIHLNNIFTISIIQKFNDAISSYYKFYPDDICGLALIKYYGERYQYLAPIPTDYKDSDGNVIDDTEILVSSPEEVINIIDILIKRYQINVEYRRYKNEDLSCYDS